MAGFLRKLSEALVGGDAAEQAGYRAGLQERSAADTAFSNAERAREQARRERTERIMADRELASRTSLSADFSDPNFDYGSANPADLMQAGYSNYAGVGQGRLYDQEFDQRTIVGDPTVAEEFRIAQMEALEPSTALVSRRETDERNPFSAVNPGDYTPESLAEFQATRDYSALRPSGEQSRSAPSGYRWTDTGGLEAIQGGPADKPATGGGFDSADVNAIYRQAAGLFGGFVNPVTGEIAGLSPDQAEQVQRITSRAAQIFSSSGVDHATAVDVALQEMRAPGGIPAPSLGQDLGVDDGNSPTTDEYEGTTATGPNGEKVIWRSGQWVPL